MKIATDIQLEAGAVFLSWIYLATEWSTAPAQIGTATVSGAAGKVYSYTLGTVTRYRFVPDTYSAGLDAFYTTYTGGVLSGFITKRNE